MSSSGATESERGNDYNVFRSDGFPSATQVGDRLAALAKPGHHDNEAVTVKFVPSEKGLLACIGPRTEPAFAGFASEVEIAINNTDVLPTQHALRLSSQNEGRAVFADFVMSYVIKDGSVSEISGVQALNAEILSIAGDVPPNWRAFEDFNAIGLHRNVPSTIRIRNGLSGAPSVDFRPLTLHSRGWAAIGNYFDRKS